MMFCTLMFRLVPVTSAGTENTKPGWTSTGSWVCRVPDDLPKPTPIFNRWVALGLLTLSALDVMQRSGCKPRFHLIPTGDHLDKSKSERVRFQTARSGSMTSYGPRPWPG